MKIFKTSEIPVADVSVRHGVVIHVARYIRGIAPQLLEGKSAFVPADMTSDIKRCFRTTFYYELLCGILAITVIFKISNVYSDSVAKYCALHRKPIRFESAVTGLIL